ncbi:MAG: Gfo/Idh/MocA family oxidoreductase [Eubacteriales bacterium]|nr:Gfo/Idh/MocA family oxidoreductase [Eubacteriales bacterium]MDD4323228.1 Gfo/Idh/MocA family oxidoreductase [Eubacteriales bacterium]MDD4541398.1 Gfo/Idh/MocA family oxidoreductase [Eubacteriales bacterium]
MKRKFRYGMVGGGPGSFIGDAHRRALWIDNAAELVAGCFSRSSDKCKVTGTELRLDEDRMYASYSEMAEAEVKREDKIDFVVVVTPNSSHFEICKTFLEAGFHVACDKPVTTTLADALELQRLAKERDLLFLVTYVYSGYVTVRQAREMIDRGEIGEIRVIQGEYAQGWLADEDVSGNKQAEWRICKDLSGATNALGDIGTHIENLVYRMTGLEITEVLANMEMKVPGREIDDNSTVLVKYNNGASGSYWASQVARGHDNGLKVRIYGEKGSIVFVQEESEKLWFTLEDGYWREIHRGQGMIYPYPASFERLPSGHPEGWFEAMANLYRGFTNCVHAKEQGTFNKDMVDYPDLVDGIHGMAFIEACLESNEKGNVWTKVATAD